MWGPTAPLTTDTSDGFRVTKTIQDLIKQNFKMLLLTIPGERVMDPQFGVGLKKYLFEPFGSDVYSKIQGKIRQQTATYIPPIKIRNIEFDDSKMDRYQLGIKITYSIGALGIEDFLDLLVT